MAEYTIQKITTTTEIFKSEGSNQAEEFDGKPVARLVEIIHNNELMRTYAVSIDFERPEDYNSRSIHKEVDWPIALSGLVNNLISRPSVKEVYITKGSLRIEVVECYEKLWDALSPLFLYAISSFFWDSSTEVTVIQDDQRQTSSRGSYLADDY